MDYGGKTIVASSGEDKDFPTILHDECLFFVVDFAIALMQFAHLGYRCSRHQMMFEMEKTIEVNLFSRGLVSVREVRYRVGSQP